MSYDFVSHHVMTLDALTNVIYDLREHQPDIIYECHAYKTSPKADKEVGGGVLELAIVLTIELMIELPIESPFGLTCALTTVLAIESTLKSTI